MSHDELNALCAEKVAGWKWYVLIDDEGKPCSCGLRADTPQLKKEVERGWFKPGKCAKIDHIYSMPSYCTDPAAVIALLEKEAVPGIVSIEMEAAIPQLWRVSLSYRGQGAETDTFDAEAPTFALAATLALLKAHGCEVRE